MTVTTSTAFSPARLFRILHGPASVGQAKQTTTRVTRAPARRLSPGAVSGGLYFHIIEMVSRLCVLHVPGLAERACAAGEISIGEFRLKSLKRSVYLDNAATTFPKPDDVYTKVEQMMREVGGSAGRSGHRRALEAGREVYAARESAVANLFGVRDPLRSSSQGTPQRL